MNTPVINVSAIIDAKTFRRFAFFDTFRLKKRWRSPFIFALILSVCACICFIMKEQREGAALLGWVLLIAGLGMPATYFLSFLLSINAQCKKIGLAKSHAAYTLRLDENEINISNDKESTALLWENAFAAYRDKGCIYLYATPQKAYLLPDACTEADALWALIQKCLPAARDFRR